MNTLCIVPARGGSKRIPHKNIVPLAGKPLLAYTIELALQAEIFSDVVVSSDDNKILDLAMSLGAKIDQRPESLSGDMIRFVQVVEEYLLRPGMREKYQNIASMLPTCPFRILEDVQSPVEIFRKHEGDVCLLSVTEYDFPPQLALEFEEDGTTLLMRDKSTYNRTTHSQSIKKAYHPNGSLYLAKVENFLREKTFFSDPLIGYIMPPERSFDIDYPYQFDIAEIMMNEKNKKEK